MDNFEFKKVGGKKNYIKYSECKKGDVLVLGEYLGTSPNKFGNDNFEFKQLEDGAITCLNHAGGLAYTIENNVDIGDVVRVTYMGKVEIETGSFAGKEAHTFDVEVASSDVNASTGNVDAAKVKEVQDESLGLDNLE